MKKIILFCCMIPLYSMSQNPVSEVVEGGKALMELIKVIKSPKQNKNVVHGETQVVTDSCAILQRSNVCFVNHTSKSIVVSIYKRNGEGYSTQPYTNKVLSQNEECWYDLRSSIYKYRIEIENGISKSILREGEFRLEPCENVRKEITE
jgi:hypothetical protein